MLTTVEIEADTVELVIDDPHRTLDVLPINPSHQVEYIDVIRLAREARDRRLRVVRSSLL
jgi:hypothetical protein